MLHKKICPVVGLTTFNTELLQISVPALGKIAQKFTLVIHNDNPDAPLRRKMVRHLGYGGDVHIINAPATRGPMRARMAIVDYCRRMNPQWMLFADDDDILVDADIPAVGPDTFAVVQNAAVLTASLPLLLRLGRNPAGCVADGKDLILRRPNMGLLGTWIRADILMGVCDVMRPVMDRVDEIGAELDYLPPVNAAMWSWIAAYARRVAPQCAPIFMDRINYIKNELDPAPEKYGRPRTPAHNAADRYERVLNRYDAVFAAAVAA